MTSEQLYSSALDSIADSVGIFSPVRNESGKVTDFVITYINPAGAESLSRGSPRNALVGTQLLVTDPSMRKSGLFDLYLKLVDTGEPIQRIFAFDQDKSKPTRHIEIRASKLGDGFVSQWREVTEDVEMHRSLVESEDQLYALNETLEHSAAERTAEAQARAKQLQELALALADAEARERKRLAQILHDHFQQLLSAAKLRAGMLRRAATDQKFVEGAQQLERLLEEAIQASHSLTNELSPPVLYDAGLNAAIKVLVRSLEQRNSLRIAVTLDDRAEPAVEQIRVLLYEAIRELLHNVLRHAKASTATVTSKVMDDGKIEIVVSDSGQGFETASLTSRHERKGTQFGLLEIRERLRFIGGDVGITSQIGSGTHVRLLVPAEVRPMTEAMAHSDRHSPVVPKVRSSLPKGTVARVVVADDHAIFREGLISLLAHEPAIKVVGIAADGAQTLKITRELRPDLLLLDVTMPLMNGIEVASVLSREIPELRIVGLSMHKQQDMAAAMLDAGAMAYFTKGGSSEVLLSMLRDIL